MKLAYLTESKPKQKGFTGNIEDLSVDNKNFRKVLYTAKHCQLVVMSLNPGEDIGSEAHANVDQFFRVEEGTGAIVIDGRRTQLKPGSAAVVPAGSKHNIINTGGEPLKLYTVYSPPNHKDGTIHATKADAAEA